MGRTCSPPSDDLGLCNYPDWNDAYNGNEGIFVVYTNPNTSTPPAAQYVRLTEKISGVETVIGTIPITVGIYDGWQRLFLNCHGSDVALILGGTQGNMNTGTIVREKNVTYTKAGGTGMGYCESISVNQTCRPWTVDALSVDAAVTLPPSLAVNDWTLF